MNRVSLLLVTLFLVHSQAGCRTSSGRIWMGERETTITSNIPDTVFRVRVQQLDAPPEAGWEALGSGQSVHATLSANQRYELAAAAPGFVEKRVKLTEPLPRWDFEFLAADRGANPVSTSTAPTNEAGKGSAGGPRIEIHFPSDGTETAEPFVVVIGNVRASAGVSKIEVRVNGKPVEVQRGFKKGSSAASDVSLNQQVPLQPGSNEIVVSALDSAGKETELQRKIVRMDDTAPAGTAPSTHASKDTQFRSGYRRRFAAVVGINQYKHWPPLEGAVPDARNVAKTLRRMGFDEVLEIYDADASRTRILSLLGTDLVQKVNHDDLVVIFFAGHGQTETLSNEQKRGYIIPVDGDLDHVFATAISMQELRELSSRLPAKHVYYAMDSCYSGLGFARSGPQPRSAGYLSKMMQMRAVQMVTAGLEGEEAIERGARGIFTTYFIQALEGGADLDNDGAVTASEIGAYVRPQVTAATNQKQTPQFGTIEGSGEVVFFNREAKAP